MSRVPGSGKFRSSDSMRMERASGRIIGGGASSDVGESIFVETDGTISVAGSFRSTANFGGGVDVESAGGSDAFVLQLNDQGFYQSVKTYGGTLDDFATNVFFEDADSFLIAGSFRGTASFDVGVNSAAHRSRR